MALRALLKNDRPQILTLWALAVIFVGMSFAGIPLLGIGPELLAITAVVFAAVTTGYSWNASSS